MATTRLGQLGVGVEPYGPFAVKEPGADDRGSEQFTRLSQIGITGAKYAGFLAKEAAEPAPEEPEVPVVVASWAAPRLRLRPVIGEGDGVLPELTGRASGQVGVVGKSRGRLASLFGSAEGDVLVGGEAVVPVRIFGQGTGEAIIAVQAAGKLRGLSGRARGAQGTSGQARGVVTLIQATAKGHHDPDEPAIIAWLLAA